MRCAFSSSSARPQGWHARQAGQRVLPVVPSLIQAAEPSRSMRTEHRHQLHSDGASTQHAAPRVAKVSELAAAARHPSQRSKPVTPSSPSPLASYEEVAAAGVSAFQRLLYVIMGGALMAMAFSSSAFNAMKESMGGAVAVKTPETERVQQPATATPPHPSAVAPAVSAGAETAAGRASTTTTPTTSTGASTEASTTTLIPKVIPKVDRKVAVKGLTPYDPAAAGAFLAGTAVADKVVVPHSLGQLLQIANTCVANGQLFALCILSERACRAQQPDIDQAVSGLAAQGVTVIAVVAGADFAQRAKLAGEYCCWELPALGEALAMQADFGMDVAVASLLPGAFARKDFVPLRLPCFTFGGPHCQADVAWEAHSPVTYVSTADVDTETWALAAAMRVLPLSAPATLHGVAWTRRQQLHQLSCLKAKLQLTSAGPAAAAHAAVAVLEAEAAAATGSSSASSASSTSFASSASSAAASTEQLPPAYLPASLSHLVPTSVVDFRRRNARATAAGKPLAVIRVSEDAWQKHDASIRAALGAAAAGSVWAEPVLLPLSLGDSCGIASPVGSRSLVPAALPALYVGGGGYLAEHWSAEADLLSGQAPAVGPTDMQEAIGLHAMRQRAWLRRREVPGVEVVVTGVASER